MATTRDAYQQEVASDIQKCVESMGCQPILFIGSGISKRYFGGPNWAELLFAMSKLCPEVGKEFAYYQQTFPNLIDIGETFAECYKEWAWGDGKKHFPKELFKSPDAQVFLKHMVCEHFRKLTPSAISGVKPKAMREEIALLQSIRPHAVITTNYDAFLETVFPDHEPVIGQQLLRTSYVTVHGPD